MKVYIDIDGVLTDGKMYIDHTGEKMFKAFHSRDVRAIRELIYNGFQVILVTADDHPSGKHFADKVGAEFIFERDKSKLTTADYAIGDDVWDVPMFRSCNRNFCPFDAVDAVKGITGMWVLPSKGGHGVIADFVVHLASYDWQPWAVVTVEDISLRQPH